MCITAHRPSLSTLWPTVLPLSCPNRPTRPNAPPPLYARANHIPTRKPTSTDPPHPTTTTPIHFPTQIGAHLAEEEIQRLAPHQHEQLGKLKEEAAKAAARAVGGEGNEGGEWEKGRDPFPSKLG